MTSEKKAPTPRPDIGTLAAKAGVPLDRVLRVDKVGKTWHVVTWETNRRGEPIIRNGRLVERAVEV